VKEDKLTERRPGKGLPGNLPHVVHHASDFGRRLMRGINVKEDKLTERRPG
jgi:hypothetical protein